MTVKELDSADSGINKTLSVRILPFKLFAQETFRIYQIFHIKLREFKIWSSPHIVVLQILLLGSALEDTGAVSRHDITPESQDRAIELLAELADEGDTGEVSSAEDQTCNDNHDGLNVTWVPSSGFCVAKDSQTQKVTTFLFYLVTFVHNNQ